MLPAHLRAASTTGVLPAPATWHRRAGSVPVGPLALADDGRCPAASARLRDGWRRLVVGDVEPPPPVPVRLGCTAPAPPTPVPGEDESYRLVIGSEQVTLDAPTAVGVRRGVETLLQLAATGELPLGTIEDAPRFGWRGLLVDVARHFQSPAALHRVVDAMAAAKLNVLHLHLSDDQAFRVHSTAHPLLTERSAGTQFLTAEDVRALVAHAAAAGIRVVPEFDIPGHTTSWLLAHPELAATPGPFEPWNRAGIARVGLHPERPEVLEFLRTLFTEMIELFPDPYLHIGGDEVHPDAWPEHDAVPAQQRFTVAVASLVRSLGRIPVVWDEAWFPELPEGVVTQVWRGHGRLRAASASGRPTLFSTPYYLDHAVDPVHHRVDPLVDAAGYAAARRRLARDPRLGPVGDVLASQDVACEDGVVAPDRPDPSHVLGGEACMWTELCPEPLLNLRLWPAAAAVAEVLWSPAGVPLADPAVDADDPARLDLFAWALARTTEVDVEADRLTHWLRLADGDLELASHIATLAGCCEPVKWYARHLALPDLRIDGPFDRFVDGLESTARAARSHVPVDRVRAAAEDVRVRAAAGTLPVRAGDLGEVAERILARLDAAEDPAVSWPGSAPIGEVLVTWPESPA